MKINHTVDAFSMAELLIAMGILAVIAGVVVPKLLNVQSQANATIAQQMADQLNKTYAEWKASGGTLSGNTPYASVVLSLLNDSGGTSTSVTAGGFTATDPSTGVLYRVSLPSTANISSSSPSNVIQMTPQQWIIGNFPGGTYSPSNNPTTDAPFVPLTVSPQSLSWQQLTSGGSGHDGATPVVVSGGFNTSQGSSGISTSTPPLNTYTPGAQQTFYGYDGVKYLWKATVASLGPAGQGYGYPNGYYLFFTTLSYAVAQ